MNSFQPYGKTNVRFVIAGLAIIAVLGAYIGHVNAGGDTEAKTASIARQLSTDANVGMDEGPCHKTGEGTYTCDLPAILPAWEKYLETRPTGTFKATVTGYSSRAQETDDSPEIAANGQNILTLYKRHDNTCATNDYAFGTKLVIPGLGTCTVRDRMNSRYTGKGHVDFYFGMDTARAYQQGAKVMQIAVITN